MSRKSLRTVLASKSAQPHDVLQALRTHRHDVVQAFRAVLPYALRHPILFELFDENAPLSGILLRLYDIVHNHASPDWRALSEMTFALEAALVHDPDGLRNTIGVITEWTRGRVRHRDVLTSIISGILESIFPELDNDVLENNEEVRSLYKKLYKLLVKRSSGGSDDRAIMLAYLYKRHDWNPVIGDMISSCIRSDKALRSDADARRTFFVDIADAMDRTHPNLRRLMVSGDQLAVHKRILKMVMDLLQRRRRNRSEMIELARLRPVLEWTFRTLPADQRPVLDEATDAIIRQRNREFQTDMRDTVGAIRRQLRSRVGVPANLPVFSQLRNLTKKSIMRDPDTERRIISMIDNLQAQVQRNRLG